MALLPNPVAIRIAAAVKANAPAPGSPVTDSQLEAIWKAIMGELYPDITATAVVTSAGATGAGPPGGPLPIAGLPGTVS